MTFAVEATGQKRKMIREDEQQEDRKSKGN